MNRIMLFCILFSVMGIMGCGANQQDDKRLTNVEQDVADLKEAVIDLGNGMSEHIGITEANRERIEHLELTTRATTTAPPSTPISGLTASSITGTSSRSTVVSAPVLLLPPTPAPGSTSFSLAPGFIRTIIDLPDRVDVLDQKVTQLEEGQAQLRNRVNNECVTREFLHEQYGTPEGIAAFWKALLDLLTK